MDKPPYLKNRFWQLYRTMADSIVEAFRFTNPILNSFVRVLSFPFALNMARLAFYIEQYIECDGNLQSACQTIMNLLAQDVDAHHVRVIPTTKPILFVGNHAGMGDAVSVLMSSPRTDIHTLVFNNGMLQGLPLFLQFAIIIDEHNPTQALRKAVRHLKQGKSVLLFPRGKIEDDPALYLDLAIESLSEWSSSIEFFVKHVPDLQVIPFAVGGVISRKALNNPIIQQYKNRNNRHFLAATFQLMFRSYRVPIVSLYYGNVLSKDSATLENVQAQMRVLLKNVHTAQMELVASEITIV